MSSNLRALMLGLATYGVYATHDALIKHLGGAYSPIQVVFFAVLFGFPFAVVQMIQDPNPISLRPNGRFWVALRSASIVAGGYFVFSAFALLPMTQVYAIIFTAPLLITLMAVPILGERVGWHRGGAVIAGLIGVVIAMRPWGQSLGFGHAAAIIGALSIALVSVITRKIGRSERPIVLLIYPMLGTVVAMGALMPRVYQPMPIEDLGILAVVAFLAWGAALLQIKAFATGEAGLVAPTQYSQIIWAVVYGVLFFDEIPDAMTLLGAAVIIVSGAYVVLREQRLARRSARAASQGRTGVTTAPPDPL